MKQLSALRILALILCFVGTHYACAEIYKKVDENGRVSYTDNPREEGVEKVDLPKINEQPAITISPKSKPSSTTEQKPLAIEILSPQPESYVHRGQTTLNVQLQITPKLPAGHTISLYNGSALLQKGTSTNILLSELYRGTYSLNATITDINGKIVARSKPVTVYVLRAIAR